MTDAQGNVVERVRYDDWRRPTFINPSTGAESDRSQIGNPLAFTGREWDAATGLYYYRYRYYDPKLGRFINRDPIGIWGDPLNLGNGQTYTGGNPLTYVDPFGLCTPGAKDWHHVLPKDVIQNMGYWDELEDIMHEPINGMMVPCNVHRGRGFGMTANRRLEEHIKTFEKINERKMEKDDFLEYIRHERDRLIHDYPNVPMQDADSRWRHADQWEKNYEERNKAKRKAGNMERDKRLRAIKYPVPNRVTGGRSLRSSAKDLSTADGSKLRKVGKAGRKVAKAGGACLAALDAGDVYAAYGEGGIMNAGNELTGINAAGSVYDIIFDTAVGKAEATIPVREDVPYE